MCERSVHVLRDSCTALQTMCRHHTCSTDNSLDMTEDRSGTPQKTRRGGVFGLRLAMGGGCSGGDIVKSHHTHQHINSHLMFEPAAESQRSPTVDNIGDDILLKCLQVQECSWPLAQHSTLGSDGSRCFRRTRYTVWPKRFAQRETNCQSSTKNNFQSSTQNSFQSSTKKQLPTFDGNCFSQHHTVFKIRCPKLNIKCDLAFS